jgi:DNA-binding NarL/FixJ family response regulator
VEEVVTIRILLVDSHAGVRRSLSTALATAEDLVVIGAAASGVEAERCCAELRPDIVLMEIQFPNEDGIDILRRIRRSFPLTQVVVLTSAITSDVTRRARAEGALACLPKYIAVDDLIGMLRAANRASPRTQETIRDE